MYVFCDLIVEVVAEGNRKRNVSKKVVVKDVDNYYYDGLDAQLCR